MIVLLDLFIRLLYCAFLRVHDLDEMFYYTMLFVII